jgi:hypothetical protein
MMRLSLKSVKRLFKVKGLLMRFVNFLLGLFFVISAYAHEAHTEVVASEIAISLAFDQQDQLWRVRVHDGFVLVDKSVDRGRIFSGQIKVNVESQKVAAKGEARPKIGIGPQGNLYLTWTEGLSKPFTGYIWFARSIDGGKTFEKPMIVHQDRAEITHRFDALNVSSDGKITVTWVDKRDLEAAKKAGKPYAGAAIYYAVSTDDGASFHKEKKLADYSCECCRIAMTTKPDDTVVAMWRHVFAGGERDHMIAEIPTANATPNLKRATFGHWKIDGCPHHGGALARGGDGANWWGYHMAYFDGNDKKPGLYYSRMDGVTWVGFPPKKFGDNARQASHPALISHDNQVSLAWLETDADNVKHIMGMQSMDGGKTWSDAFLLLSVKSKADYPQLLNFKGVVYLAVNTDQGLKVVAVRP